MKLPNDFNVKNTKKKSVKKTTRFVSEKEPPLEKAYSIAFDKNGNETVSDNYVCKSTKTETRNVYSILTNRGSLYDVEDPLPRNKEYTKVNKRCYDNYVNFIQTREHHYYEKAVRANIGT